MLNIKEVTKWLSNMEPKKTVGSITLSDLKELDGTPKRNYSKKTASKTQSERRVRRNRAWSKEEDVELMNYFIDGVRVSKIAVDMGRSVNGVRQRIYILKNAASLKNIEIGVQNSKEEIKAEVADILAQR